MFGYVRDARTDEALPYSTCHNVSAGTGVTANEHGFFSLSVPQGYVQLEVSYVGYTSMLVPLLARVDTLLILRLHSRAIDSVVVRSQATPFHTQSLAGKVTLSQEVIRATPTFMGERDILKTAAYLPGVSLGHEGYAAVMIRGGNRDQNLILLDGSPIFNTTHMGGFISLFNSNAIQHVDVYKGGFPARFGGRASSVLDIRMREGSRERVRGEASLGILSAGVLVEGPLHDGRSSFLLAARNSHLYLLQHSARQEVKRTGTGEYTNYNFFDVNAKFNHRLDDKRRVFLNFYTGGDHFRSIYKWTTEQGRSSGDDGCNYGNLAGTLGYNQTIGPGLNLSVSLYGSRYNLHFFGNEDYQQALTVWRNQTDLKTGISEVGLNVVADITPLESKHTFKVGAQAAQSIINPAVYSMETFTSTEGLRQSGTSEMLGRATPRQLAFFVENRWQATPSVLIHSGLRASRWQAGSYAQALLEPRLTMRWRGHEPLAFGLGYSRTHQPIHGLMSPMLELERDFWIPASGRYKPQMADQVYAGIYYIIPWIDADLTLEGFYRSMSNLLELRPMPNPAQMLFTNFEDIIVSDGEGEVYGMEILLERRHEMLFTAVAYTLSWNNRRFAQLNGGRPFPSHFDRRHDIALLINYKPRRNLSYGAKFVVHTGAPINLPIGYYPGNAVFPGYYFYGDINAHRLPLYHRLDLSMRRTWDRRNGRQHHLSLDVFNAYARINPTYISINYSGQFEKNSMFRIIPSVTYTFEF